MLDQYRSARYQDGGRGELVGGVRLFDCYGLVRAVRPEQYGLPTMPELASVCPNDPRQVHRASSDAVHGLSSCSAQPGAMALCWTGNLALHCGVVVPANGRLGVLECHHTAGIRWQPLRTFCNEYTAVEYYT
ncbi:hypothetical protein [Vreelandella populi]|uniref:NlpC/P60 domain-containing protein n=1 Tax=Vreelandella populi TaxID=2498858 RepID=A0A433LG02_9GAMM|nr:hypothetical protein [Halomonas populi]RUR48783.1 hypothetical protein ELY37_02735 [Halomonas populi]